MLFPREQKQNKRGWTKGRPIALQKLHDNPEQYSYLNAQDQRICQCIETETVSNVMDILLLATTFLLPRH